MPSLLRKLIQNWKLKLAAFGLAVLLWVVLGADQVTTQWLPVRVEVEARDPTYALVYGPVPEEVEVRFIGPGRELWELAINRPRLRLRIDEVQDEEELLVLNPQMVTIPRGLSVVPQDVRPSSVRMGFTRLATRDVPVTVPVGRGVREGYTLVDSLVVQPARVRVSGSAERVATVTALATRPLDLSREDTVFVRRVPLDTTGVGDLRLSTYEVEVSGYVDSIGERTFSGVAIVVPPGTAAIPGRTEVRLRGPESQLRRLSARDLQAVVPTDAVPAQVPGEGVSAPLRLAQLPRGVTAVLSPGQVRLVPLLGTPAPPNPLPPAEVRDTLPGESVSASPGPERETAWRRR